VLSRERARKTAALVVDWQMYLIKAKSY